LLEDTSKLKLQTRRIGSNLPSTLFKLTLVSVSRGLLLPSRQITLEVEYGIESAAS